MITLEKKISIAISSVHKLKRHHEILYMNICSGGTMNTFEERQTPKEKMTLKKFYYVIQKKCLKVEISKIKD